MKLQGKSLIVMGKIVNVIGEPHDNYRVSPQSVYTTGIPYNIYNISLKKTCGISVKYAVFFYRCCRKNPIYIANILRGSCVT